MIETAALQGSGRPTAADAAPAPSKAHPSAFHQLLSELNPLQYLPVVGTIYRAITGDTIPEAARIAGSMVVSGLTGGPVGLAINVGTTLLEKASGIDPERIAQRMFAAVGARGGANAEPQTAVARSTAPAAPTATATATALAWSQGQLAAYGIGRTAGGDVQIGGVVGADVLNGLELHRLHMVA